MELEVGGVGPAAGHMHSSRSAAGSCAQDGAPGSSAGPGPVAHSASNAHRRDGVLVGPSRPGPACRLDVTRTLAFLVDGNGKRGRPRAVAVREVGRKVSSLKSMFVVICWPPPSALQHEVFPSTATRRQIVRPEPCPVRKDGVVQDVPRSRTASRTPRRPASHLTVLYAAASMASIRPGAPHRMVWLESPGSVEGMRTLARGTLTVMPLPPTVRPARSPAPSHHRRRSAHDRWCLSGCSAEPATGYVRPVTLDVDRSP